MNPNNNEPIYHIPIVDGINNFIRLIGHTAAWANVILIGVILVQVTLRYGFNNGMVQLEELIWHFYAVGIMFGLSYAMTTDSHIRVDLIHMILSPKKRYIIEILGITILLMPFLWTIIDHSISWVYQSYEMNEASANPTGLSNRWIIKAVLPLSFILLFLAAIARLIQSVMLLLHKGEDNDPAISGRVSMMSHLFSVTEKPNTDQPASEQMNEDTQSWK